MTPETDAIADEAAIRTLLEAIASAVRARDVEAFLKLCAPDVVIFDLVPPLAHRGADAARESWKTAVGAFSGPAEYESLQLEIAVSGDVAFACSLNRFGGTTNGKRTVSVLRTTLGLRRIDGRWKVAHEHVSAPFDMA